MKIIDPLKISKEALPLIVFSDDRRGLFSFGIRVHTKGNYSHCMVMIHPGRVVTQGATYKEIPILKYMAGRYRLKFWQPELDGIDKRKMITAVEKDLKQPFWKKWYDGLGVVGQLFRIRWLQSPWQCFCSERVAKYLRMFFIVPKRPSPAELNRLFEERSGMKYYGHYLDD